MKILIGLIWFLVWGAFSSFGPGYILSPGFPRSTFALFNGLRAYAPFLSVFLALILFWGRKPEKVFQLNKPLVFLSFYGLIGFISSLLSPQGIHSAYWAMLFLSVPLTGWFITGYGKSLEKAKILLQINWIITFSFVLYLSFGPLRPYILGKPLPGFYMFPGKIARITQNGVGRYAGIAALIALSRIRQKFIFRRQLLWFLLLAFSLNLLSISQSRAALLGFAGGAAIIIFTFRLHWIAFFTPIFAYIIYLSGFLWGAHGSWQALFYTPRGLLWREGLELFSQSPLVGFGFHADRYLLGGIHMHNAFFQSLVQSGILGTIFFIAAIYGIWFTVIRRNLIKKSLDISRIRNIYLSESIVVLIFFTIRSFFESTAAFYGADLFFVVPAILFIQLYGEQKKRKYRVRISSIKEGKR